MQYRYLMGYRGWVGVLIAGVLAGLVPTLAEAQVVPDGTLGRGNNSALSINGNRTDIIGGLRLNSALFHSFDQFSVGTNRQVYFANPVGVRDIFSRVTGGSLSNIDGVLGVSGSANLFFMNPNGILFGPNARLDVAGAFTATTASGVEFADNQRFAATGDRAVPLVEVNVPIGLQFGANPPAMLTNQGNLAVAAGQSLTLAGGNTTNTGSLTAPGGTVQVLGQQVALLDNSQIDVSSAIGGGTVLVGGDYQGKGSLLNAQSTIVGQDAIIKADALVNGNGGKVIVWADGDTRFNGTISAQGGVQGGNGGFVETSGKQTLGVGNTAVVNTFAALGQSGTWLLDPQTITIINGTGNTVPAGSPPPTAQNIVNAVNATANDFPATIDANVVNAALASGNVTLTAELLIAVISAINSSANTGLDLTAPTLNLNANVTTGGSQRYAGAVTIGTPTVALTTTNSYVTFTNTVNSVASAGNSLAIAAGSGNVAFNGALGTGTNGALGTLNITSGAVQLNTTNANNLNVNATGDITQTGALTIGGTTTLAAGANSINLGTKDNNFNTVQVTSSGTVTLKDTNALILGTSNITGGTGNLNVTATGDITQTGNLTVGGTTTLAAGNANNITLTGANNFNTVQISRGNDVSLNDVSSIDIGTSNVAGNLNVTGSVVNVPNGVTVDSSGGNITLNGTTSVTNSGSLVASGGTTAPGRTVQILGGAIRLDPTSSIDVSGTTGGTVLVGVVQGPGNTFTPTANTITKFPAARINADGTNGNGGTVVVRSTGTSFVSPNNITADGSLGFTDGVPQLPSNSTIDPNAFFNLDPTTSVFSNITIVNGNGQSIITDLQNQNLIPAFFLPVVQNDPILAQLFANTLYQDFRIPQTVLEGTTTSLFSSFLTGQDIRLTARNNITIQDLTTNQLALTAVPLPASGNGSINFGAGGLFGMNQTDSIQTNGRDVLIRANGIAGANSLTIGGINASSPTAVGGNIQLNAVNGNIAIGNGTNPAAILSNSANNTTASSVQIQATNGTVNINNTRIEANSSTTNGLAGQVSINAANGVNLNQTNVSANGQFGSINIGSPASRPNTIVIQNNSNLSAQNNLGAVAPGVTPIAGSINLQANTSVQVNQSTLSSNASGVAAAGGIIIRTTNNSSGTISLTNSSLESRTSGSGAAGAINLEDANTIELNGTTISNTVVDGTGGRTTINGGTIAINSGTSIKADTTGKGKAGDIEITTTVPNPTPTTVALTIDNSQITARTTPPTSRGLINSGSAGTISLKAINGGDLAIRNDSIVSSSASGNDSGNGGTVDVSGQNLSLLNGSIIQARSTGTGAPGSIAIDVPNTINVSGTSPSGQISEISTFSGANANLNNSNSNSNPNALPPGDIRINQRNSPVRNLNLSERGRINASTQSINAASTGGNIQVYADNLNITSGGQIVASSLDGGNLNTPQAGAGNINVVSNNVNISGSQPSFNTDPSFTSKIFVKPIGNVNNNGTLLSTRGGEPVSTLAPALGIAIDNPLLSNAVNGSGVQLSVLGNVSGALSFNSTFLTNENGSLPTPYNDSSFVTTTGGSGTSLANVNTGSFGASGVPEFSRATTGNPTQTFTISPGITANVGVVNVGDLAVDSGLKLGNFRLDGVPVSALVSSPDINPNETFTSGIFAKAGGSGNAGSVTISGTGATSRVALSNGGQISTSTERGGTPTSGITLKDLNSLTVSGKTADRKSEISASTNSGTAGSIKIDVTQGVNPNISLTGNSSIAAKAGKGGTAGSVSLNTPTLGLAGDASGFASVAVSSSGIGTAGNVDINASNVTLNKAQISAETDAGGASKPANINLRLQTLDVNSNSKISSSTKTGVAGNVLVNASGTVNLTNGGQIAVEADGAKGVAGNVNVIGADINLVGGTKRSEISTSAKGDGASAGGVTLTAAGGNITLQNSDVLASSQQGASGKIEITARRADLNNGTIKAETGQPALGSTADKTAGSITLNLGFRLTLENESEISTLGRDGANGGNITIMGVRFLSATAPTGPNGSDIVGRAENNIPGGLVGQGGTVTLDRTTLVSGFRFRKAVKDNGTNDIDTNGQLNNFSTDADVAGRGLSTPLIVFNDVSQIARSACEAVGAKASTTSELKITGQGGVPQSPTAPLPAQNPNSDWVALELSPQVPIGLKTADGSTLTLEPGKHYQLPATCIRSWQQQQRSQLSLQPALRETTPNYSPSLHNLKNSSIIK